jgi:hypothetical protein
MPLDFLNNVILLDLPFEAAQGAFKRFTLLQPYFSQEKTPPNGTLLAMLSFAALTVQVKP